MLVTNDTESTFYQSCTKNRNQIDCLLTEKGHIRTLIKTQDFEKPNKSFATKYWSTGCEIEKSRR